jgi:hypothetical protein
LRTLTEKASSARETERPPRKVGSDPRTAITLRVGQLDASETDDVCRDAKMREPPEPVGRQLFGNLHEPRRLARSR